MNIRNAIRENLMLLSHGDGHAEGELTLPADFPGFQGHFPGFPTLPGVCQIQIMEVFAELATGEPFKLTSLSRTKFFSPVSPDETMHLLLKWTAEQITMEIHCGERKVAVIKGKG